MSDSFTPNSPRPLTMKEMVAIQEMVVESNPFYNLFAKTFRAEVIRVNAAKKLTNSASG